MFVLSCLWRMATRRNATHVGYSMTRRLIEPISSMIVAHPSVYLPLLRRLPFTVGPYVCISLLTLFFPQSFCLFTMLHFVCFFSFILVRVFYNNICLYGTLLHSSLNPSIWSFQWHLHLMMLILFLFTTPTNFSFVNYFSSLFLNLFLW